MFVTLGSLFGSMVISILEKSTCARDPLEWWTQSGVGVTLDKLPSCYKQHMQDFRDFCTWLVIPGHQKHSTTKTWYGHALDDLHLCGTHSEWQHGVPWGP